jgi:hypothetical protein
VLEAEELCTPKPPGALLDILCAEDRLEDDELKLDELELLDTPITNTADDEELLEENRTELTELLRDDEELLRDELEREDDELENVICGTELLWEEL